MTVCCSGSGLGDHEHISGIAGGFRTASGCDARPGLRIDRACSGASQACTNAIPRRVPELLNYRLIFVCISYVRQCPNVNRAKINYFTRDSFCF